MTFHPLEDKNERIHPSLLSLETNILVSFWNQSDYFLLHFYLWQTSMARLHSFLFPISEFTRVNSAIPPDILSHDKTWKNLLHIFTDPPQNWQILYWFAELRYYITYLMICTWGAGRPIMVNEYRIDID